MPCEMIDAVLALTCRVQRRVRDLPARVVVYLLLAGCLFADLGYLQVWRRLVAGLDGLPATLITYQALRTAMADATGAVPGPDPDRARFAIALQAARDQVVLAAGTASGSVPAYTVTCKDPLSNCST
ncbi:MAG TPA: transposase domain-containing protein [Streptosporangiaceae bacterium]|nr:transposase domain-containing protein [Streptosporangiaceae bacterium]